MIHVGEGRVTRDEGRPGIQFDVPASIFTAMMMEEVPLDIYATVLCFRRGTWQRCVLTQTEVDDCDGDTFFSTGSRCLARPSRASAADS